jgi:hypothetical protein
MAVFVLTNAKVDINSVDLSDHVRSVQLEYQAELQDETAMGDGTRQRIAGLKDWSMTFEFNQDFAASKVDATLWPLVGGSAVTVAVRPVNAAKSATNPEFTGSAVLESYGPVSNSIGELATAQAVFRSAGDLARSTS